MAHTGVSNLQMKIIKTIEYTFLKAEKKLLMIMKKQLSGEIDAEINGELK